MGGCAIYDLTDISWLLYYSQLCTCQIAVFLSNEQGDIDHRGPKGFYKGGFVIYQLTNIYIYAT